MSRKSFNIVFACMVIVVSFVLVCPGLLIKDAESAVARRTTVSRGGVTRSRTTVAHGGVAASRTVVHHGGSGSVVHHHHHHSSYHSHYHPVARGVAVGTAIAIGTRVATLPVGCTTIYRGGITYSQCGSVYYRPYYEGSTVVYVVVEKP
jgi:hypothetical protein